MRFAFVLTILVSFLGLPLGWADEPQPRALPEKELTQGQILLLDGLTSFGWTLGAGATVDKGTLCLEGKNQPCLAKTNAWFGSGTLSFEHGLDGKAFASNIIALDIPEATSTGSFDLAWLQGPKDGKAGPIGFQVPANKILYVRNLRFTPGPSGRMLNLFNGLDLKGWKVHPDKKSTFTVDKEEGIVVKDGPGDLQTAAAWADFLLQVEVKSHGKHLNSGVFFRCRPGEYQQGYEMQVRNQFTEKASQDYVIEEYDPESHKLLGKRKIQSPAVDYGTGAIYRRMPARLGFAQDGAWAYLTLIARGNHFATWVNGVQVVDWTDHRPQADNARQGCCLKAGPISLQGHDPTTNLSFRNFRLQELK